MKQKSQRVNKQISSFATVFDLFGRTDSGVLGGQPGPLAELIGDSVHERLILKRAMTVLFTIGFLHSL